MTPQEVADIYSSLGYDFIAFTDHDYLLKPDTDQLYDSVKTDLIIFKGVEITVFEKGYVHVNRIYGDDEELHMFNHLGEYDLTYDQVMERIQAVSQRFPIDCVEITTKGFPEKQFDVEGVGYPRVAADDSHTRGGCGRAWIEMDCRRAKDSIIRAVKQGRFWNCYAKG